jgi:hypothetical protein
MIDQVDRVMGDPSAAHQGEQAFHGRPEVEEMLQHGARRHHVDAVILNGWIVNIRHDVPQGEARQAFFQPPLLQGEQSEPMGPLEEVGSFGLRPVPSIRGGQAIQQQVCQGFGGAWLVAVVPIHCDRGPGAVHVQDRGNPVGMVHPAAEVAAHFIVQGDIEPDRIETFFRHLVDPGRPMSPFGSCPQLAAADRVDSVQVVPGTALVEAGIEDDALQGPLIQQAS